MTEVEPAPIVRDVAELYEPVAEEKGVELVVDAPEPITLTASRELLGQALANLIDNAIKHGARRRARRSRCRSPSRPRATATTSSSRSPTTAPASPRPTASACSSASSAWRRAGRSRAAASD